MGSFTSSEHPAESAVMLVSIKRASIQLDVSESAIWEKLNPRSRYYDPDFPKPIKIGGSTRLVQQHINAYVEAKIIKSRVDATPCNVAAKE